jgi:cadherin-like protein
VAGWDRLATAANTPLTINREGLVSNDFDADSDELT